MMTQDEIKARALKMIYDAQTLHENLLIAYYAETEDVAQYRWKRVLSNWDNLVESMSEISGDSE